MEQTLYQVLGVSATANFAGLKRAYYARARECHPDLFGNSPVKTREFQILCIHMKSSCVFGHIIRLM